MRRVQKHGLTSINSYHGAVADDDKDRKLASEDDGPKVPEDDRDFHDDDGDEEEDDDAFMAMGDMVVVLNMPDAKISISVPSDMGTRTVEKLFKIAVDALGQVRIQMN